uniref:2-oxoglutarate dehydrogenase, mitochondrial n=2 Tax=Diabrotica virgifera virgifera TaxID=50390 RepID=A0A6P7HEP6_DIAVI
MNQLIATVLSSPKRIVFENVIKCLNHKKSESNSESALSGSSAQYLEDMYNSWLKDPSRVHSSWDIFFRKAQEGTLTYYPPTTSNDARKNKPVSKTTPNNPSSNPQLTNPASNVPKNTNSKNSVELKITEKPNVLNVNPVVPLTKAVAKPAVGSSGAPEPEAVTAEKYTALHSIIRGYQVRGHYLADVDPLGTTIAKRESKDGRQPADIISPKYKINESDLDKLYRVPLTTRIAEAGSQLPLREILARLEKSYCQQIGVEYMYIPSVEQCDWIRERFEPPGATDISEKKKRLLLIRLARTHLFEQFCAKKYPTEKRFGIEGLDSIIPLLKTIIDRSSELGVEMFVIGMAHRGRLNVIVNVCRKSLVHLFAYFEPLKPFEHCSGDVKYHLGVFTQRMNRASNKNVKLVVLANPSHLGSAVPATVGKVRAEQFFKGDVHGNKVMAILIHGDAAVRGQGVHFELMNMSELPCYTTHGIIHVVANNQIGFTTLRAVSGSSPYCTDIGRSINAPVFHVNADYPEKCIHVAKVASEWRNKFHRDVMIDLVGYRRHGHQEVDDPTFTSPVLYKRIAKMKTCYEMYEAKCLKENIMSPQELKAVKDEYLAMLEKEFQKAKDEKHISLHDWLDTPWEGFYQGKDTSKIQPTGVPMAVLDHICKVVSNHPPPSAKFALAKSLERVLKGRQDLHSKKLVDWSMGEACAFGAFLKEGIPIRMTGEDVERGTFSHRHHVYHHQDVANETYCPLQHIYPDQASYTVCNSSLAEYAVMGYEHGYSFVNPNAIVIWEAQFGDFSNTAQPIFDQMVSSSEDKWARQSGFIVQLPHGMEGAGPEHSSCRPERLLDMASEDPDEMPKEGETLLEQLKRINWIVTYCSVPANHFHAIRRQMALPFRKPLMMMTPKALLRHPEARSSLDDMKEGSEFRRVIPDDEKKPSEVQKILFCSGKVFYDVREALRKMKVDSKIAMIRIEQLAPFPFDLVKKELQKYPKAKVCWLQEEHKNQGFWDHMEPRLRTILRSLKDSRDVSYVGRAVSSSPATGFRYRHLAEVKKLHEDAARL